MAEKRVGKKSSMTQEERNMRSVRAKRRFKALVRNVIANRPWLEEVGDEELGENVKKNVQLLTKKKEKKSLLTIQHKTILNKPAEDRTEAEKLLLYKIIGGLSCFRKYPEHVKMRLAGVTYFYYYGPNRVIVRQNQEAFALYFIVTGEVIVSITTFDPVLNEKVTINVGTMVPGNMFGEVSLLHDIPRTATITTSTPCELLCLKRADFNIVLKASVQAQWDEVQRAMKRFTYFAGWDEVAVRECCILAKKKIFAEDETILGDGTGAENFVHFVLRGKCRVIEHLLVTVNIVNGVKRYSLYKPKQVSDSSLNRTPLDLAQSEAHIIPADFDNATDGSISSESSRSKLSMTDITKAETEATLGRKPSSVSARPSGILRKPSAAVLNQRNSSTSFAPTERSKKTQISSPSNQPPPLEETASETESVEPMNEQEMVLQLGVTGKAPFQRKLAARKSSCLVFPVNVETHFMQVCIFSETACFGLGENMRKRRIVAMSEVECLLIPNYWIWQRNKGNLWTRIQQFLDTQVPSTERVFKEFLENRKWRNYKKSLLNSILPYPASNLINNVPYSIRITEDLEFADK